MRRSPRLLLDAGPYPLGGDAITGIGLRVAELAQTLAAEFPVRVHAGDTTDCVPLGAAELLRTGDWPRALAESDVVFFFDLPDTGRLEDAVRRGVPIVSENAPPVEHMEYPSVLGAADPVDAHRRVVAGFIRQLQVSDHFVCRSQVERTTLIASLCVAGRLCPADVQRSRVLSHLVSTIPIGFSAASAVAAEAARPAPLADVLWTGGLWSYFDPLLLVESIARCRARGAAVTAAFLYGRANGDAAEPVRRVAARITALRLDGAVTLHARPVRHQDRDGIIKAARVLVCVAHPGIENETCVRLRVRDSRLYGLPTIVDPHGPTGRELADDGLGWVLARHTADDLADALVRITATADANTTATATAVRPGRARAGPLARYRYDRTATNLMAWLEGARHGTRPERDPGPRSALCLAPMEPGGR
jgi:hypothetical protein